MASKTSTKPAAKSAAKPTNETKPSPFEDTPGKADGRHDHIGTQGETSERVPDRSEGKQGVVAIDADQTPVTSAPTDELPKRDAPSDLPIEDGGAASPAEPKNEADGFKGAANQGGNDRLLAPGAPLEPAPERVVAAEERAKKFDPHHPGEVGAALIREARPGSRLLDAATNEAPEVDGLFVPESKYGTALRSTVRLVQHTYAGPQGRPLRQLVMTKGQVIGPEKARQVVAILKAQLQYEAAEAEAHAVEDSAGDKPSDADGSGDGA